MSVQKRRRQRILRRQWSRTLACKWDLLQGRDRGCQQRKAIGLPCDLHQSPAPTPDVEPAL